MYCLTSIQTNITTWWYCLFEAMTMRTKPTAHDKEYIHVNQIER